jgi:hypothetical protein
MSLSPSPSPPPSISFPTLAAHDEHDPGATWLGPRFDAGDDAFCDDGAAPAADEDDDDRLASATLVEAPPLAARRPQRAIPAAPPRPSARQLALATAGALALTAGVALISQYLFTYLFTGHW